MEKTENKKTTNSNYQLPIINYQLPLTEADIRKLTAGGCISITGDIYTARDAAHKRMITLLENGKPLPFDVRNQAVYYAGPCPALPGKPIGAVGPTTSSRMDSYAPRLIKEGLRVMIGKGMRSSTVIEAIKEYKGIYLSAVGGAGAYYSKCVKKTKPVAFEDLGTEAIYKLTVEDMKLVVAIDCNGESIYK